MAKRQKWISFMLVLIFTCLLYTSLVNMFSLYMDWWSVTASTLAYMCLGLPCFWVLYVLFMDLGVHKRAFFRHNMVNSYLNLIRSKEALQPFQAVSYTHLDVYKRQGSGRN